MTKKTNPVQSNIANEQPVRVSKTGPDNWSPQTDNMNIKGMPEPNRTFDEAAVVAVIKETDLPLVKGMTESKLRSSLEKVASQYCWDELVSPVTSGAHDSTGFDEIADSSVTPSRLLDRLVGIERSAKRIFAGKSRRPLAEKVAEILERLGYDGNGKAMRHSGTEGSGHGGSERSAVWHCMIAAINATEYPPKPYRPKMGARPWASQRLAGAIQLLGRFVSAPSQDREEVERTARAIHEWAQIAVKRIKKMLVQSKVRHHGNAALDGALTNLAKVYKAAFGKRPSLYRSGASANPWIRFAEAALTLILAPGKPPTTRAIEARWRRGDYART
jgi:hypothetical protein